MNKKPRRRKPDAKHFIAGVRMQEREKRALIEFQRNEGASTLSDALRIILDRSGVFDAQQQPVQ